ncbi:hypothetical protein P9265_02105 [Schinkia azotoformans]|uniref:hypothetical protein n=1 Tax=Schinkia azotoformans TaxID=1454 RepID=UPI002E20B25A|nr:hypothetical protein [Schinkia azotoformans]
MDEVLGILKAIQDEQREFRMEMNRRLEVIEKYAIHNGEKLDNNREHVGRKISFIEHKNLELEQRIYELESRFKQ